MLKLAVLVSGSGTNLQAIIDRIEDGSVRNAKIEVVISNNPKAYALERAKNTALMPDVFHRKALNQREAFNEALLEALVKSGAELIVLAGFMVVVPPAIISRFRNKIINIHPSLIPSFCGQGYYGLHVHEAALKKGVKISGATVHFVDEGTDTGPIIMQKAVEVKAKDTPEVLQRRIMEEAEWVIMPAVIDAIAGGRVRVVDGIVEIEEE